MKAFTLCTLILLGAAACGEGLERLMAAGITRLEQILEKPTVAERFR